MKNVCFMCLMLLVIFCSITCKSAAIEAESQKGGKIGKVISPAEFKPPKAKKITVKNDGITIDIYARDFAQGNIIYLECYANNEKDDDFRVNKITYGNSNIAATKKSWGFRAFLPIATDAALGNKSIDLQYKLNGDNLTASVNFTIIETKFPVSKTPLDLGKYSNRTTDTKPEVLAFIKESKKKKDEAFASREKDLIGNNFSHPRDIHYLTSPFWSKRVYQNYKINKKGKREYLKPSENIHRGTDFRGVMGAPVYAMADGKIVLADLLYYEGNMILIDHGNKFFSYYMHMSALDVKKGDMVKAGDTIGKVGSTGISTGAHLHVSMLVNYVHVDPLSLLSLPVRD